MNWRLLFDLIVVYILSVAFALMLLALPAGWLPFDLTAAKSTYDFFVLFLLFLPLLLLKEMFGSRFYDLRIVRITFFFFRGIRDALRNDNELSYEDLRERRRAGSWGGFFSSFAIFCALFVAVFATAFALHPLLSGKLRYDALGAAAACIDLSLNNRTGATDTCAAHLAEAEIHLDRARQNQMMDNNAYWLGLGYLQQFSGDPVCGLPEYATIRELSGLEGKPHPYQVLRRNLLTRQLHAIVQSCDQTRIAQDNAQTTLQELRNSVNLAPKKNPEVGQQ